MVKGMTDIQQQAGRFIVHGRIMPQVEAVWERHDRKDFAPLLAIKCPDK